MRAYHVAEAVIQIILDEGETLEGFAGPCWLSAPVDPENSIYAALVKSGVEAEPYQPPPPALVTEIHMAWLRAALAEVEKLDAVNAAVNSHGPVKQVLWDYATAIRIDDADVVAIAGALKINLRTLFDRADEIRRTRG